MASPTDTKIECGSVKELTDITEEEFVMYLRTLMSEVMDKKASTAVKGIAMGLIVMASDLFDNWDGDEKGNPKELILLIISAINIINS